MIGPLKTKGAKQGENAIRRSGAVPIYKQIAENLKQRIGTEEFSLDQKLPSSRDLADFYKVNHLTVRQALKQLAQEKIIDIAHGRGSFILKPAPNTLRTALVLPSLGHEQSGRISRAVREQLGGESVVHVMDYHESEAEEAACLKRILSDGYNSAVVYPSMNGESVRIILKMLVEGFPLVLVDRAFGNVPASYVLSDNRTGGYLATRHLLDKGCRQIACFVNDATPAAERLRGYRDALGEQGIRFRKDSVVRLPALGDIKEEATAKFLAANAMPDGIFYSNDYEALKGMKQIKAAGLRIPQDIRVVGFDDLTLARYAEPPLTSVRQNHEEVGRQAAELLAELVTLPLPERFMMRRRVIPVELVVREST